MLLAGYFVEITIKSQIFHASVGRIQLSRFCFSARNFQRLIFNYLLFDFHASAFFRFQFSSLLRLFAVVRVCWQFSIFTLPLFRFQLFKFLLASSNFHASDLSAFCGNKCFFQIGFACVISA